MSYTLVRDDSFPGGNTSVGVAGTSTGLVNWIDFAGNFWNIVSHVASNARVNAGGVAFPSQLAYDANSGNNFKNGKILAYTSHSLYTTSPQLANESVGVCGRFVAASGGSCYGAFYYMPGNTFYIWKMVNGALTQLHGAVPSGVASIPANKVLQLELQSIDSGNTQITVSVFDQADLTTVLGSVTYTDNEPVLQVSGAWGFDSYAQGFWTRVQTYSGTAPPVAGTPVAVSTGITTAKVNVPVTGGSLPLSYAWHRSTTNGFTPGSGNAIGGSINYEPYRDSGLAPNTTYYYVCVVTDALSSSVTSSQLTLTTRPTTAKIALFIGDSISTGYPSGAVQPPTVCMAALQGLGYNAVMASNQGVIGSNTTNWVLIGSGGAGYLETAIAAALDLEANTIIIDLGVNDAKVAGQLSSTAYKANMLIIINALLAGVPGCTIILNAPTYVDPTSTGFDATSDTALQAYAIALLQLDNTTDVRRGYGTAYADILANAATYLYSDKVHLTASGYTFLGQQWAIAFVVIDQGLKSVSHPAYVLLYTGVPAFFAGDIAPLPWYLTRQDGSEPAMPSSARITIKDTVGTLIATLTPDTDPSPPAFTIALASLWAVPSQGTYVAQLTTIMPVDGQIRSAQQILVVH